MSDLFEFIEKRAALFTALAGLVTIVIGIIGFILGMRRKAHVLDDVLKDRNEKLEAKTAEAARLQQIKISLDQELAEIKKERHRVEEELKTARAHHESVSGEMNETIENAKGELARRDKVLRNKQAIVNRMLRLEGQLWEGKALAGTPRFRPLSERRAAVFSVLNLKGGVGKTTITAYLASAFALKGYRVLLIDFDLQGTLSSFFLSNSAIAAKYHERKLLQHFLGQAAHKRRANLLDFVQPIFDGKCGIVPTSDKLAYAEMNLTMSWLLKLGKKDTRFLLRRALHQRRIAKNYDIVLMDCPPLINTCCVNALAASDYLLIPVNPSKKVAERVQLLLKHVKALGTHINPHLQVAGAVLNRTRYSDRLTAHEEDIWGQVLARGKDELGIPLHGYDATIPQTTQIRDGEGEEFQQLEREGELFQAFDRLATEMLDRIPSECHRSVNLAAGT